MIEMGDVAAHGAVTKIKIKMSQPTHLDLTVDVKLTALEQSCLTSSLCS